MGKLACHVAKLNAEIRCEPVFDSKKIDGLTKKFLVCEAPNRQRILGAHYKKTGDNHDDTDPGCADAAACQNWPGSTPGHSFRPLVGAYQRHRAALRPG